MSGKPKTPSNTRKLECDGLSLHVTEYGVDAEPLILLHGIGSRVHSWWPVIDELARSFRLIVPDHRGHGLSDKPATGYLIPDYVSDLERLITAYGIEQPLIMGHSLGGMITLNWATRNPDRARKIVIEDSPMRRAEDVEGLFNGWIRHASMPVDEVAAEFEIKFPGWSPEEYHRRAVSITSTALPVFEELKAQNLKPDTSDRIAKFSVITSPVLLVYGEVEAGGMVPHEDATRFEETLPNGRTAFIPKGTHSLHRDSAESFLSIVLPFLQGS